MKNLLIVGGIAALVTIIVGTVSLVPKFFTQIPIVKTAYNAGYTAAAGTGSQAVQ